MSCVSGSHTPSSWFPSGFVLCNPAPVFCVVSSVSCGPTPVSRTLESYLFCSGPTPMLCGLFRLLSHAVPLLSPWLLLVLLWSQTRVLCSLLSHAIPLPGPGPLHDLFHWVTPMFCAALAKSQGTRVRAHDTQAGRPKHDRSGTAREDQSTTGVGPHETGATETSRDIGVEPQPAKDQHTGRRGGTKAKQARGAELHETEVTRLYALNMPTQNTQEQTKQPLMWNGLVAVDCFVLVVLVFPLCLCLSVCQSVCLSLSLPSVRCLFSFETVTCDRFPLPWRVSVPEGSWEESVRMFVTVEFRFTWRWPRGQGLRICSICTHWRWHHEHVFKMFIRKKWVQPPFCAHLDV